MGVHNLRSSYGYNIDGIRNQKAESGISTDFLLDLNRDYAQVIQETTATNVTDYTYGDDLVSQSRNGNLSYYLYDGLGSTRALINDAGTVTDTYDYEAFGDTLNQTGTTKNSYLYTGEQYDSNLDNYYLRARYYDQNVGRFTQMDEWRGKLWIPVTLNKYIYANSDAVNGFDPSGYVTLNGQMVGISIQNSLRTSSTSGFRVFLKKTAEQSMCLAVEEVFGQALIDMTSGIYIAQDLNGSYAGQTNNFDRRLNEHKRNVKRNIQRMFAKFEFLSIDRNERRLVEQFIMNFVDEFDGIPDRVKQNAAIAKKGGSPNTKNLRKNIFDLDFCKKL